MVLQKEKRSQNVLEKPPCSALHHMVQPFQDRSLVLASGWEEQRGPKSRTGAPNNPDMPHLGTAGQEKNFQDPPP